MSSLNSVKLIGRIGKDPVPHIFQDGSTIIGFSVATTDKWKDKKTDEWKEVTEWHNISIINPVYIEYTERNLNKGDLIYLEGSIRSRKWIKKDSTEGTIVEIVLKPYQGKLLLLKNGNETTRVYKQPVAYDKRKVEFIKEQEAIAKLKVELDEDDVLF